MTILIVDDDADIRDTLAEFLQYEGFATATATNGHEAWVKLQTLQPCLILLDLLMPEVDGNELYRRLQADPAMARIPVVISTSDPSRAPPGTQVIRKPVDLSRILASVRRYCSGAASANPYPKLRPARPGRA